MGMYYHRSRRRLQSYWTCIWRPTDSL